LHTTNFFKLVGKNKVNNNVYLDLILGTNTKIFSQNVNKRRTRSQKMCISRWGLKEPQKVRKELQTTPLGHPKLLVGPIGGLYQRTKLNPKNIESKEQRAQNKE
jgi:hypothetical protein